MQFQCVLPTLLHYGRVRRLPGRCNDIFYIDDNSGSWTVEIWKADRYKTDFTSYHGLFQFIRMTLRLKIAAGTFKRLMNTIFSTVHRHVVLMYLYSIFILSKALEAHIRQLQQVLTLLCDSDIDIRLNKCRFFSKTTSYLGHIIHLELLLISQPTTNTIRDLKHLRILLS